VIKQMEVSWSANPLAVLEHDVTGYSSTNIGWREFSFVVPGSGLDRLTFRSLATGNAGPTVDAVSLSSEADPVPMVDGLAIGKAVAISWPTATGTEYQVQWAAKLGSNVWTYFGPPIAGNGATNYAFDVIHNNSMRIYRVLTNQ
jgi:hypothetical protein